MNKRNSIKTIAVLAGVSIRTLQYYDKIGLLSPDRENNYRKYTKEDLKKLQQILFYRELDFPLKEIITIMNSPDYKREKALADHKKKLQLRKKQITILINTIDNSLEELKGVKVMSEKEILEGFNVDKILEEQKKHEEEMNNRFDPNLVNESNLRMKLYSKEKMAEVFKKGDDISVELADLMDAGKEVGSSEVQEQVDIYFHYINESFYTCSLEIFESLGKSYTEDERFKKHYEEIRFGLASFVSEAVIFYCRK